MQGRATELGGGTENGLRLLKRAIDATQNGVMITDATSPDDPIIYVNRAFELITGYAAREVLGRNPRFLQAGDEDQPTLCDLRKARLSHDDDGVEWTGILRNYGKDGTLFYNELSVSSVRDEEGRVTNHVGTISDVTKRERAEEKVRFQARMLEAVGQAVVAVDLSGRIVYSNRAAEGLYGWSAEEAVGRPAGEVMISEDQLKLAAEIWAELASGRDWSGEFIVRRQDGGVFMAMVTNTPVYDEQGNLVGIIGVSADITERKRAEEALRESNDLLRSVMEGTPDAVFVKDFEGRYAAINRAGAEAFGKTVEEVIGGTDAELFSTEDGREVMQADREIVASGEVRTSEDTKTTEEGVTRTHLATKGPYRDGEGRIAGVFGVSRDITERKRAEEALRESEQRFRYMVRNSSDIITLVAADGTVRYSSPALGRILGYAPEERVGRNIFDLLHPDDAARTRERFAEGLKNPGVPLKIEVRQRHKDGSWRDVEVTGTNLLSDRSAGAVVLNSRDVTERKRVEEALRESEARFRSVAEGLGEGLLITDADGDVVLYANPRLSEMTGYAVEEMLGRPAYELLLPPERWPEMIRRNKQQAEGTTGRYEMWLGRKDRTFFWAEIHATPYRDAVGAAVGTLNAIADITERNLAEEALKESEERFRQLFEHSVDALLVIRPETREVVDCNREACRSLKYAREELLALRLDDFVLQVLTEEEKEQRGPDTPWRRALSGEPGTIIGFHENVHRRKDGTDFPVEVGVGSINYGGRRMILASCRDVTERKRAEEALREGQARLAEAQRIARVGSWEYAVGEDEAHWSDEMYGIFGRDPRTPVPAYRTFLRTVHPDDRVSLVGKMREVLYEGKHHDHGVEFRIIRPNGETRAVHVRYEVVRGSDDGSRPTEMAGTLQDVTERKALEERLEHQAFHDPLTGLANRALFSDRLAHALARADRRGETVAVLFLDLDNFKYVNDSLGHDAGDLMLAAVAGRLKGCIRPGDTVARLGGDEFAVLLEGAEDAGGAIRVAERVTDALQEPFDLRGHELFCATSVGIALDAAGRGRPEDLLRKADLALYEAKREGKARYALFDPETERRSMRRLEMENGLRRALERDEIVVFYQPVISLKSGRVAGFEALARWEHPERGLITPDEFVPLAEETGLIVPIGERVLGEACRQAKKWQEARHPPDPSLGVGVNLSAVQLKHPRLVEDVGRILEETGLDPGRLTFEVTESVLVEDAEQRHAGTLRGLKDLGVRFAIDDFGTGYSSLSYLKRLPAGLLKLDGLFVEGIGKGAEEDEVLLRGVVGIAHGLGLHVVAEAVETPEQAARLRELGCDLAQGQYFSAPLPGEAVPGFLAGDPRR